MNTKEITSNKRPFEKDWSSSKKPSPLKSKLTEDYERLKQTGLNPYRPNTGGKRPPATKNEETTYKISKGGTEPHQLFNSIAGSSLLKKGNDKGLLPGLKQEESQGAQKGEWLLLLLG
ncbi:hypothetical protein BB559_006073 [Furculomyces boomerangus]|uniref:Uncharacterized protein n=1 Tax=Furculomyces boomerangus TaxID=61424 RepID=A0A2T9Y4X4_9FUNG|nr:hypothetical protein BB559_006073 [Furculomyces boomerangus]